MREENESLKTLWTDMRVVLTQSINANCLASYGATQADAVEAANRILNAMPKDVTTERENLRIERDALRSLVMPLLAERDQLRTRVAALEERILADNKAFGCELRDPNGTIWEHADKLQKENADLRRDREYLDWLEKHFHEVRRQDPGPTMDCEPVRFSVWTPEHGRTNRFTDLRSAVRAARAKDAKTEGAQ